MYSPLFNHFHSQREQCRLVSNMVLTFETMWMKSYGMTIQVKPLQQYFHKGPIGSSTFVFYLNFDFLDRRGYDR